MIIPFEGIFGVQNIMRPITITLTPSNQSTTVYSAAATISGASPLLLTAAAASISPARILGILSAADDHTITFAVVGLDADGNPISESVTGSSGAPGTAVTTKFYSSITSITTSGSSAGNVSVGNVATTLSAASNTVPMNFYERSAPDLAINVTGTINYTVQETFSDVLGISTNNAIWVNAPTGLVAQTSGAHAPADISVTGVRILINSYSSGATLTARIVHTLNYS
jgi:hypothetical protein